MTTDERERKIERTLARIGFEAATTIHDLSNVVGAAMGYAQLAAMATETDDMRSAIQTLEPALRRARNELNRFKTSHAVKGPVVPFELRTAIRDALDLFREEWAAVGLTLRVDTPADLTAVANRDDALVMLRCLALDLAARAAGPALLTVATNRDAGRLCVSLSLVTTDPGPQVDVALPGSTAEALRQIAFDMGSSWIYTTPSPTEPTHVIDFPALP